MRTIEQIKEAENMRLTFMRNRDGLERAIEFAQQTYLAYRAQRKMRPMKYGRSYRDELIVSCVVFRKFLRSVK